MKYDWTQLGIIEFTNLYLYEQLSTPSDLTSESLIRPLDRKLSIDVDVSSYMATGPGRFALGSQSSLVQSFFRSDVSDSWFEAGRSYSKVEVAQVLRDHGMGDLIASATNPTKDYYGINIHQAYLNATRGSGLTFDITLPQM